MRKRNCNNTTGYQGVTWRDDKNKYHAKIGYQGDRFHLGYFSSAKAAALVYDKWSRKLFGIKGHINFPKGVGNV